MAFPHTRGKEDGVGEKAGVFHGFSTGVLGKMGRGYASASGMSCWSSFFMSHDYYSVAVYIFVERGEVV